MQSYHVSDINQRLKVESAGILDSILSKEK